MKSTLLAAAIGFGAALVLGAWSGREAVFAQRLGVTEGGELIAFPAPAHEGHQLVTVINPRTYSMNVYQVDLADGKLALKSARNIGWDLRMTEFNAQSPLPREIQAMLEPQK